MKNAGTDRRIVSNLRSAMRDERGSISIASVFALMLLVMLLGLVVNVGRQVDRKVKLQHAADATTQSSGIVLARQMNALAFSNHLMSDVFALTAGLREVQKSPPPVSQARQIWLQAFANSALPALESILASEMIPQYQRSMLVGAPALAQTAADGIAQGHSAGWPRATVARGYLWAAHPSSTPNRWLLPVIDPSGGVTATDELIIARAQQERRSYARRYLSSWNREWLGPVYFTRRGRAWRNRTQRQLDQLLGSHRLTNLPLLLRPAGFTGRNPYLEQNFHFLGVVYALPAGERIPGVFHPPLPAAQQAYAQLELFIPRNRLMLGDGRVFRQDRGRNPGDWSLWNQNWSARIVPATSSELLTVLSATPDLAGGAPLVSDRWRRMPPDSIRWLSHH